MMTNSAAFSTVCDSPWFLSLVLVSGVLGAVGTGLLFFALWLLKLRVDAQKAKAPPSEGQASISQSEYSIAETLFTGVLTGVIERLFFTFAIWALDGMGSLQAAVAWIAMKGQVHFQIFTTVNKDVPRTYLGLLGSLVSMAFAILGGYLWLQCATLYSTTGFCPWRP